MDTGEATEVNKLSKTFASRLKQEREQRAWTQNEVAERIGSSRINISRWENGVTLPGPFYRQKLGELFNKSIQELGFFPESSENQNKETPSTSGTNPQVSPPALPFWSVPYRRNPFFTGREGILPHLYTVLRSRNAAALTQAQAISGLGGIGKTQIAIEYAYRYRDHYQAIFWVNASTREVLSSDFASLAALLDLPEQGEQEQDIVIRAVKRWLTAHTAWLLILDNADKPELIVEYLPGGSTGDVLLTTRAQTLGMIAQSIEVEKLGLDEGMTFLLRRTRMLEPGAPLDQALEEDQVVAAEIVSSLDGLPLALDQAGAYIEETQCGLSHYVNRYATRRRDLLLRRGRFSVDHPDSVVATWSLSFQMVEQECPAAADLLRLLAFLNPESIPEEVLTLGATELGPVLGSEASDPLGVDALIELLLRYSLIRRNSAARSLSIHRLVQAVLRDGMERDLQRLWVERAIRAVNCAFPDVELDTWESCQRLLPHVQACAMYGEDHALSFLEAARLFNEAASYLISRGRYGEAELLLLQALTIRQKNLEADHPDTARVLNDLGVLYRNKGKYPEAEDLLQRGLAIRQQVLGEKHHVVAETLHHLASLFHAKGAYAEAEPYYVRALQIRELTLGMGHPLVAQSYYGLAKLHYSLENYQQAEKLCLQALHIQEHRLGPVHPMIASTLNMLGKIYQGQQRLDLAEEMNLRALWMRETISGADHPHIATIANSLAEIYLGEGRYLEAEPLIVRSLRIHKQSLGLEHPFIAYSYSNLAESFYLQGDHVQAESYYKKALAIREQNLGENHPHTASTYVHLAKLYFSVERYEEAESFYRKALSVRERIYGSDHRAIANILEQYARLLRKLKRIQEATELEAHIQVIRAKQAPQEDP